MTNADLTLFLLQVGVILGVTVVLQRTGRALKLRALVAGSRAMRIAVRVLAALRQITIEVDRPWSTSASMSGCSRH